MASCTELNDSTSLVKGLRWRVDDTEEMCDERKRATVLSLKQQGLL